MADKKEQFMNLLKRLFSSRKRVVGLVILLSILGFTGGKVLGNRKQEPQYQTTPVEKGILVTAISGSGTITSGNYTNISTKVSGVVKKVLVTNGDKVVKGQKIAEVTLDDYAQERQTAAWVLYLEATEAVKDAQKARVTADIQMWNARQTLLDAEETYKNAIAGAWNPTTRKEYTYNEKAVVTKTFEEAKKSFTAYESKYLNSEADVANAKAKVSKALRDYQENSATIVAPTAGVVSDLALAEGITVSANSTTSSTSGATIVSAQTVGKINDPQGQLIASVSLSEIDVLDVKANQKVTLTLDAYSDKTFTGKVLAVNTSGTVSSGVTSYPVTILLDPVTIAIYPNMAVNAQIITNIVSEVIIIPTTAITTTNGVSTVQVKKEGKITTVQVELGSANDSQTEIKSGINEGEEVVTSVIMPESSRQTSGGTTSPFSGLGGSSSGRSIRIEGPPGGF